MYRGLEAALVTETGSRLLLGVAAVLAGTTVLLGVFGLVYNPVLLLAAVPFAAATYFLWSSATGRLDARLRERVETRRVEPGSVGEGTWPRPGDSRDGRRARDHGNGRSSRVDGGAGPGRRSQGTIEETAPNPAAAASVLEVDPGADEAEIRRAFREKARQLHPDTPDGDEAEFRRVRDAYERLTERR